MSKILLIIEFLCLLTAVGFCIAWFAFNKTNVEPIVILLLIVPLFLELYRRKTLKNKKAGSFMYGVTARNNSIVSSENSQNSRIINTEASNNSSVIVKNSDNATVINTKAKDSSNVNIVTNDTKT